MPPNSRIKIVQLACLVAVCLTGGYAYGGIYVSKSIVTFKPGSSAREDVRVSNPGDNLQYVKVEVFAVQYPGTPREKLIKVTDPQQHSLVATPAKLVIPPHSDKLIRILDLDPTSTQERVYRINVTPIPAPIEERVNKLRFVVAYQILVIIQPEEPFADLDVSRTAKEITFNNRGNTNVLLSLGRQCAPDNPDNCEDLAARRLYADTSWRLNLPFDVPVTYKVRRFDSTRHEIFP